MAYYQNQGHQQFYANPPGPPPQYPGYQQYAPPPGPPPQAYVNQYHAPNYQTPPVQYQQPPTYHHNYPSQYQQPSNNHQRYPSQNGDAVQSYRPRTGFTNLPTRFHIWNSMEGSSSYMLLGSQHLGAVAYSAKAGGGSKTKVKAGPYQESVPAVGEARSKGTFSSKSIIYFEGYETVLEGGAGFHSGSKWPLGLPVRGRQEQWEWRRRKDADSSLLKKFLGSSGFGDWELCPGGSPPGTQAMATWTNGSGGSAAWSVDGAEMGIFQFHGQAAAGAMGDQAMAVAILSMLRMLNLFIIEKAASMAASAVG